MNFAVQNPANPQVLEIPDPPERFGEDGGKFYRCYDALAEEIDDDLTKGLKEQLDGMLIFAGLFAGVNTAFLALTIPLLSPDPSDDTNALLAQNSEILMQWATGRNATLLPDFGLPSTTFSPSSDIFTINTLFSLSLAFAIVSSFLAVLGRQWLVYYRKRGGGGPDRRRWEQLKRFLGAERWKLEPILDDVLPSLLQIGLLIFCTSFVLYLRYLNPRIAIIVGIPMVIGLAFFLGSALCTLWDRFCPFYSPLSHSLSWASRQLFRVRLVRKPSLGFVRHPSHERAKSLVQATKLSLSATVRTMARFLQTQPAATTKSYASKLQRRIKLTLTSWLDALRNGRREESISSLQAIAVQRTICISGDPIALLHAIANTLAIESSVEITQLWKQRGFRERFLGSARLVSNAGQRSRTHGVDSSEWVTAFGRLYSSVVTHMWLSINEDEIPRSDLNFHSLRVIGSHTSETSPIPDSLLAESSPSLIQPNIIALTVSNLLNSRPSIQNVRRYLVACSETFATRSDLRFCGALSIAIIIQHENRLSDLEGFRKAYQIHTIDAVLSLLSTAFDILLKPESKRWPDCNLVIVNIIRGIRRMTVDDPVTSREVETNLELLGTCERILRDPQLAEAALREGRELRLGIAQLWSREKIGVGGTYGIFGTWSRAMASYFAYLKNLKNKEVAPQEDMEVVRVFYPMIRALLSYSLYGERLPARNRVREAFNEFVSDTYRPPADQVLVGRSPDERWCHSQRDLLPIKTIYLRPGEPLRIPSLLK